MDKHFRKKIKDLRNKNKMTLEQAAKVIGTSGRYWWTMENREVLSISAIMAKKIATLFGVKIDYLMDKNASVPSAISRFMCHFLDLSIRDQERLYKIVNDWAIVPRRERRGK